MQVSSKNMFSQLPQELCTKIQKSCTLRSAIALKCTTKANNQAVNEEVLGQVLKNHLHIKPSQTIPVSLQNDPLNLAKSLIFTKILFKGIM